MKTFRRMLWIQAVLTLMAVCATQLMAQDSRWAPPNPGIFKDVKAPLSPSTRFWASEHGKDFLLHSANPGALGLLHWFHPDAVSEYPQPPRGTGPAGSRPSSPPSFVVTGCNTTTGTVMNLESPVNALAQYGPQVDFILSELGSGKDLVAEYGFDTRYEFGTFDSTSALYVHRDGSQQCYGGTDFEMGNPPIADPNNASDRLTGAGNGRLLADPSSSHKQFIIADTRYDNLTSGVGLRRIPVSNLESTSTCPMGTLSLAQEATCAGTNGIIVFASEDNYSDAVAIAQDQRSSGTGAGDIYVVESSIRELRTVILISACKATFTSISDCSSPVTLSGSTDGGVPSVAVVGGGSNAGSIVVSFGVDPDVLKFVSCTPHGAPNQPTCGGSHTVTTDTSLYSSLSDNPGLEFGIWPQIVARTDASGQTIFIVWSDCKDDSAFYIYGCAQSQVVTATDTSLSSPSFSLHHLTSSQGHRFLPSISYDPGQGIVNVAYYYTVSDIYKNRSRVTVNQILPGSTSFGSTIELNSSYDSMEGDGTTYFFDLNFGDFIGVASHGGSGSGSSRVYVGFTSNARQGMYGTGGAILNTQADNAILRATY